MKEATHQKGVVKSFSSVDGVGRITLDDGTEVRFGTSAFGPSRPAPGIRVAVEKTAPHPLGGKRALAVRVVEPEASYVTKLAAFEERAGAETAALREAAERDRRALAERTTPDELTAAERAELASHEAAIDADRDASDADEAELDETAAALRKKLSSAAPHERIRRALGAGGVEDDVARRAAKKALPIARPELRRSKAQAKRAGSRLGGAPDLPTDVAWPRRDGRPLAFVAQIVIEDLPVALRESLHLDDGRLTFFYDVEKMPFGTHVEEDAGSAQVLFTRADADVARVAPSTETPCLRAALEVTAWTEDLVPPPTDAWCAPDRQADDRDAEADAYEHAIRLYERAFAADRLHGVGGFAPVLQDIPEETVAAVVGGDPSEWRCLLTVDSDPSWDEAWGDAGVLSFFVRDRDLRAKRFDRVWALVLT